MQRYFIHAAKFFLPAGPVGEGYLEIVDGKFGHWTESLADMEDTQVTDMGSKWIAPGFVDTHIHGYLDHDVMDADPEGILAAGAGLAQEGTTSWLPTTLTASVEQTEAACAAVAEAARKASQLPEGSRPVARIQGIFLEGPFFTEKHKGAQNPSYMFDPDYQVFCQWQQAAGGLIRKSAFAPERAGSEEYAQKLREHKVVAALGHSDATFQEGLAAVNAGATMFVHTYNGMSGLHHRNPGLVGLAMSSHATFAELIADGMHVNRYAVEALVHAKGFDHVCLVSDCLRCGGMPEGEYPLGEFPVIMKDGLCRLKHGDSIAGSVTTLAKEVQNLYQWEVVTAEQAIYMGTAVPALAHYLDDRCGFILPGRVADFVVLDSDLNLVDTYMSGRSVKRI